MSLVSAGRYRVTYTVDTSHAIQQLIFVATVTVGAVPRTWMGMSQVSDDQSTKLDALYSAFITTHAELTGIPSQSAGVLDKIELLFMALRNKFENTNALQTINNNAGNSIGTAAISDDGTTYTKDKFS